MFRQFCEGRGQEKVIDWKTVSGEVLSPLLAAFYVDAKTQDGSPFSKNSLKAARGALQRHLSTAGQTINIFNDQIFSRANKVLDGVLKQRKKDGLERQVQHKAPISEADWKLLQEYFSGIDDTNDAVKLTYYVWFHLTLHFCLRGGEMQAAIKKDDLVFFTVDGKEILKLGPSYMSKNHQGGLRGTDWSSAGVIEDPQQIAAIKRYVSKLHPDVDRIFQRAMGKRELSNETPCWFAKSALSHNLLSTMMKRLSSAAGLSQPYTNHCVRSTSITHLKQAGIQYHQICSVSGHRNVQSLEAYDQPSVSDTVSMAAAISRKQASATCSSDSAAADSVSLATGTCMHNQSTTMSSAAISPYLNATGSSAFLNCPITFNIHAERASKARAMLKRKHS